MCCCCYSNPVGAVWHSSTVPEKKNSNRWNKLWILMVEVKKEFLCLSFCYFQANQMGHNVWSCLKHLQSETVALLHQWLHYWFWLVSPVFFLCGPRYTHIHTAEGMWPHVAQKISACGIWIANAPHVSLEKVRSAQEDFNSLCRRWSLKEET